MRFEGMAFPADEETPPTVGCGPSRRVPFIFDYLVSYDQ
jgi:hypothetical protein